MGIVVPTYFFGAKFSCSSEIVSLKELNIITRFHNLADTIQSLRDFSVSSTRRKTASGFATLCYRRVFVYGRHTRGTYSEGVLDDLEFLGSVLSVGHHFADDGLDVVHPFQVLGTTEVVHFLDEAVVLLPERHGADSPPGKRSR